MSCVELSFDLSYPQGETITMLVLSDTHCLDTDEFFENLPKANILLHCGDFTNVVNSTEDLKPFCQRIQRYKDRYDKVFVITGNHEHWRHIHPNTFSDMEELLPDIFVRKGLVSYHGLNMYLVSFPEDEVLKDFVAPPEKVHVFVTHVAAAGSPGEGGYNKGTQAILNARNRMQPNVHIFGHSHNHRGHWGTENNSTLVEVNGSMFDDISSLRPPYFLTFNNVPPTEDMKNDM